MRNIPSMYANVPWRAPLYMWNFIRFDLGILYNVWGIILKGSNGNWIKRFTVRQISCYKILIYLVIIKITNNNQSKM